MDTRCTHLRLNGARCAMPALRGNDLCFQHDHRRTLARRKPFYPDPSPTAPLVSFLYMEDHIGILHNLNEIARAFSRSEIDHRQVTALTYLMQTCLKTLRQMQQLETKLPAEEMPTAVVYGEHDQPQAAPTPDAAPPPKPTPALDVPHSFQTLTQNNPATPLFPTLTKEPKISAPFSNTCISEMENSEPENHVPNPPAANSPAPNSAATPPPAADSAAPDSAAAAPPAPPPLQRYTDDYQREIDELLAMPLDVRIKTILERYPVPPSVHNNARHAPQQA